MNMLKRLALFSLCFLSLTATLKAHADDIQIGLAVNAAIGERCSQMLGLIPEDYAETHPCVDELSCTARELAYKLPADQLTEVCVASISSGHSPTSYSTQASDSFKPKVERTPVPVPTIRVIPGCDKGPLDVNIIGGGDAKLPGKLKEMIKKFNDLKTKASAIKEKLNKAIKSLKELKENRRRITWIMKNTPECNAALQRLLALIDSGLIERMEQSVSLLDNMITAILRHLANAGIASLCGDNKGYEDAMKEVENLMASFESMVNELEAAANTVASQQLEWDGDYLKYCVGRTPNPPPNPRPTATAAPSATAAPTRVAPAIPTRIVIQPAIQKVPPGALPAPSASLEFLVN